MSEIDELWHFLRADERPVAIVLETGDQRWLERTLAKLRERGLGDMFEQAMVQTTAEARLEASTEFVRVEAGEWLVDVLIDEGTNAQTRALGRLLAGAPDRFGPVLTVDFLPTVERAIERAGGRVARLSETDTPGGTLVVRLHPYALVQMDDEMLLRQLRTRAILVVGPSRLGPIVERVAKHGECVAWCDEGIRDERILHTIKAIGGRRFGGIEPTMLFEALALRGSKPVITVHEPTGIEFVWIPAGGFWMGTADDDEQGDGDERPRHRVELASFELARTPVTNEQYARFLAARPDVGKPKYWDEPKFNQPKQPVIGISWHEAQAFCDYYSLVLPTEAQWEYAARGKTETQYWSGNGEEDLALVGWYKGNSGGRPHGVAEKPANPFGLFDVHGNVWEWCRDAWGHYTTSPQPADGLRYAPDDAADRAVRGGGFAEGPRPARSAFRFFRLANWRAHVLGFRPARLIP